MTEPLAIERVVAEPPAGAPAGAEGPPADRDCSSSDHHRFVRLVLHLTPRSIALRLGWLAAFLVFAHIVVHVIHYRVRELPWLLTCLFDLDEEQSFPTWFSAVLLLIAASPST
jgi:hypothetical protein